MAELLKLLNDPIWASALSAAASIALAILARKGWNIPILSDLLTYFIGRHPGGVDPNAPAKPVAPAGPLPATPILDAIWDVLAARLGGKAPAGYTVTTDGSGNHVVTVQPPA